MKRSSICAILVMVLSAAVAMEKQTKPLNIFICKNTLHEDIRLHITSDNGAQSILYVNAGTQQYIFQPTDVEMKIIADSDKKLLARFNIEPTMKIFYVTMHDAERLVHVSNSFNEKTPLLNTSTQIFTERDQTDEQSAVEVKNSQCFNCSCQ